MADLAFLHGGMHGSWCWKPLLEELSGSELVAKTLALDMPGSGTKRTRDHTAGTIASIAAELNQDIRNAGLHNVVLIGHSIAGVLLPVMAAADPGLFSKLIYLAPSLPIEGQSISELLGTKIHDEEPDCVGFPVDPVTTSKQDLQKAMFAPDLSEEQLSWLLSEAALDKTPKAVQIEPVSRKGYDGSISATYIVTLRDPILPVKWQRIFAERALCEEVIEIDTPHEPFVSHPALLMRTLSQIINTGRRAKLYASADRKDASMQSVKL